MKVSISLALFLVLTFGCKDPASKDSSLSNENFLKDSLTQLSNEVKNETLRSWHSYKKYAWGHDVLKPLSGSYQDWYSEPLFISPIDAYSTLHLMGFYEETSEIESYVEDSLDFDKDIYAKIFEVNIRVLGGLLAMYDLSGNEKILEKAIDFGDRMMPAFNTKTGIPRYWVNLKTGESKGDTVNVAEAATYTMEMGILSYYSGDSKYYDAAKKATRAIFDRRSSLGLIGDVINVQSGEWVSTQSHICAGVDSYYEYMYKSYLLFGDKDLLKIWNESIEPVHEFLPEKVDSLVWYGRSDMNSGEHVSSVVTLYDAFFPAILALSGDTSRAEIFQWTWHNLWMKYGLEPMVYDYRKGEPNYPVYDLNPEIIESAYYLYHFTRDPKYLDMNMQYWSDIKEYCKTKIAFTSIEDVRTMKKKDYMPTFFFAETLKYLYLTFSYDQKTFRFDDHIFNTEAHQFKRSNFQKELIAENLGI